MMTRWSKGAFSLEVDWLVGGSQMTLTVDRREPFDEDSVRRLNRELVDYGAELVPNTDARGEGWVLRVGGADAAFDLGDTPTAVLKVTTARQRQA